MGESLWWMTRTWAITAGVVIVIVAVLIRFTRWGRQFWRVTGDYFKGRDSTMGNICSSAPASGGWAARRVTGPSPCEPRAVS